MAAAIGIGASTSAFAALTLTVGAGGNLTGPGIYILGEIIPAASASSGAGGLATRDETMIDTLRLMGLGIRTATGINPEYYRSTTSFGILPDATQTGMMYGDKTSQHPIIGADGLSLLDHHGSTSQYVSITLPTTSTYQYLVGAYDGRNGGAEAWYIGNIAAGTQILIPRFARPSPAPGHHSDPAHTWPQNLVQDDDKYEITSWTMFNPTPVPEPTTMIAGALLLLPFGASTLRALRRNRAA